jgi:hypothetical protein
VKYYAANTQPLSFSRHSVYWWFLVRHVLNWLWFGFLVTWYWQVLWVGAAKNNCIVVDHFDWTFCACVLQVGRYRLRSAIGNTASPSTTANRRIQVCSPARRPTDSQTASQSMLWVSVSLFAVLYWSPPPIIATQTFLSLSLSLWLFCARALRYRKRNSRPAVPLTFSLCAERCWFKILPMALNCFAKDFSRSDYFCLFVVAHELCGKVFQLNCLLSHLICSHLKRSHSFFSL